MGKVKIITNTPGNAPKPVKYASIDGQGKIPYGEEKEVSSKHKYPRLKARGMGAAVKGGKYSACVT